MTAPPQSPTTLVQPASTSAASAVPTIQADGLTKVFGSRVCVDHLTFHVNAGELYALLGDNGAGKTTTINMLTTLLKPSSGSIHLSGYDVIKHPESTKGAFGVVSQEVALYAELTAYENLAFIADLYNIPKKEADLRIVELLNDSGLADRAHDMVGDFSTGMQRKLSIAIAMIHKPKVIFMDEPTVGLDPAARRHIWEVLARLKNSGVTILLTTHYLEEAEFLADRIGIIRRGKLVMEGTIDELRDQIRAVRTVSVWLAESMTPEDFAPRAARFQAQHPGTVELDAFRNTITFTPPASTQIVEYLELTLQWLKQEKIAFEKFATTEPSLEDIFLAVTRGRTAVGSQG
jgi:ABC-2 type transport system ATP-binding protein